VIEYLFVYNRKLSIETNENLTAKFNITKKKIIAALQLGAPAAQGPGPMARLARG